MPTYRVGDIDFGIDADTSGLEAAIGVYRRFTREVDAAMRAQGKGATEAASALGRQESALRRAFQQTLNLI